MMARKTYKKLGKNRNLNGQILCLILKACNRPPRLNELLSFIVEATGKPRIRKVLRRTLKAGVRHGYVSSINKRLILLEACDEEMLHSTEPFKVDSAVVRKLRALVPYIYYYGSGTSRLRKPRPDPPLVGRKPSPEPKKRRRRH